MNDGSVWNMNNWSAEEQKRGSITKQAITKAQSPLSQYLTALVSQICLIIFHRLNFRKGLPIKNSLTKCLQPGKIIPNSCIYLWTFFEMWLCTLLKSKIK